MFNICTIINRQLYMESCNNSLEKIKEYQFLCKIIIFILARERGGTINTLINKHYLLFTLYLYIFFFCRQLSLASGYNRFDYLYDEILMKISECE